MKTTLDLPDAVMRRVKVRAAREDRKLTELITELLECGLAAAAKRGTKRHIRRAKLPLIKCVREPKRGEELTPAHLAAVLLQQEVEAHHASLRP